MKIVFDTNVILSSFLTEGIAHKIFHNCIIHHEIYISAYIINELNRILIKKFSVNKPDIEELNNFINANLRTVKPVNKIPDICRDKNDNQILQLAEFINADIIISGDKDLLTLKKYAATAIISPREFYTTHIIL